MLLLMLLSLRRKVTERERTAMLGTELIPFLATHLKIVFFGYPLCLWFDSFKLASCPKL